MQNRHGKNEAGFTLVELLVIVAIIGILAAIAIPQFSDYRKRGFEATVKSDLKNAAVAQEAYFAQYRRYKSGTLSATTLTGYNKSAEIAAINATALGNTFTLHATHTNCAAVTWSYNSATATITGAGC